MIAYKSNELTAKQIMRLYNVREEVAGYLEMIHPFENIDWWEYEELKGFLSEICLSTEEYERANMCLIDKLEI